VYDVAVIGGGVNGCGIARDAAGRGLSVLLVEKQDLASGTSSASTKLIHGGLRYLEHYEFRLVRESLLEREVLWRMAPHIIKPLRFVLPHHQGLRPAWLIRLGLFLYDHLGGRERLPGCRSLDLRRDEAGKLLKARFVRGFEYSDCWVDDARLVVLNAVDAAERGADIRVGCELASAVREDGGWRLSLLDQRSGERQSAEARVVVNAAGPWVAEVLSNRIHQNTKASVRLVKGSHIVVPKIFDHERAYIFQHHDQRIIFAIPYEDDFTLIGTTDVDVGDDPEAASISEDEIRYLCAAVSEYFERPVAPTDVVWSYSGIRPLFDDGTKAAQKATRDYVLELDRPQGEAALLNVFGGKITTYRRLAEEVLEKLAPALPGMGAPWTLGTVLPGGEGPEAGPPGIDWSGGHEQAVRKLLGHCPAIGAATARRLIRSYGTRAWQILEGVAGEADLGAHFGAGLYQREVAYLVRREWAHDADDILWRRSKLGLRLNPEQRQLLSDWLRQHGTALLAGGDAAGTVRETG
jgi:glycerol-3-phosphate dehydrogenase